MISTISDTKNPRIAFVFNKGRLSRLPAAREGVAPREFFFGAFELEKKGYKIGFFEVDTGFTPGIMGGIVNWLLNKGFLPAKTSGGLLKQIRRITEPLRQYDFIIGTTSGIAFSLAIFKKFGFFKTPLIAIHCGLLNQPYNIVKRLLTDMLLRNMYTILYGEGEREPLINLFPGINGRLTVNQFGVDINFWQPILNQPAEKYVLAVGNDGRRDYDTLIKAAPALDIKVIIVTKLKLTSCLPQNVEVIRGSWHEEVLSDVELRSLYQNSLCVVVPLKQSYQPSGQSVCLQAMACGKPVVLTETQGIWDRRFLKHLENILLVQPGDIQGMVEAIRLIRNDKGLRLRLENSSREHVIGNGNIEFFADHIEKQCLQTLIC